MSLDKMWLQAERDERRACAELVRAAGCICVWLDRKIGHFEESGGPDSLGAWVINDDEHDHCCPIALAKRIQDRKDSDGRPS